MPGADLVYFAVLSSAMHMAWMRTVAGRLKSDYSYSPAVYNSFTRPKIEEPGRQKLITLAQAVRDERAAHSPDSLSDLYERDFMPPSLRQAHLALDRAIDRLYRAKPFASERERVEHLFELYETGSVPLATQKKPRRKAEKK